jgi:hypothetical protein
MIPLDCVLAVALLATPQEDLPAVPDGMVGLRPTLQQVALSWEILDPREVRYILAQDKDFATDVRLLRRRYHDLQDAPPVADSWRFPPRQVIGEFLAFNRKYRQHLQGQRAVQKGFWWELHEAIQEADRLYDLWDTVRDARCEYYYVTVRRQALKKLREMVGEEVYESGDLPPHVPVWRFARID